MKKMITRGLCLGLSALTAFSLVNCGKKKGKSLDTESRPVVFASDALDGNFNPFFSTSGPDTEIASLTQIGLLSTDASGNVVSGENEPCVALDFKKEKLNNDEYTEYKFIIKKGIKFSDGVELTIKDVLFNLYVYLDPAYMGSATIYSTDIVGLAEYRTQQPGASSDDDFDSVYEQDAQGRMENLIAYWSGDSETQADYMYDATLAKQDEALFKTEHEKTLNSHWTYCQDLELFKDEHSFTTAWENFLFYEGIIRIQTNSTTGKPQKDSNGKYITDASTYAAEMNAASDIKTAAIGMVYGQDTLTGITMTNALYRTETYDTLFNFFVSEARMESVSGDLAVPNISGITVNKTNKDFKGKSLGSDYDMLTIKINGVDPKAEYNFGFAVTPMHYYSGSYGEKDYIEAAMAADVTDENNSEFGVKWGDPSFFQDVLQAGEKNAKPVGAGPYQASNRDGEPSKDVSGGEFFAGEWVYFTRNENFTTVGDAIENAKIKHLRYKVVATDALLQALESGDVDIGEPNATADNMTRISNSSTLAQKSANTNGYGYVGINPKYVPDIEVRRAIMMVLDTSDAITYYTNGTASQVHRSMSKESWVWDYWQDNSKYTGTTYPDENLNPNKSYYGVATSKEQILAEVAKAGYYPDSNGKLKNSDGETLKYTFTIAGATTDHPAYNMFMHAASYLNQYGFDITVTTDVSALKKLARGELEVWAAAWSSTIDPDMYQVYHIDSTASSTKNWGYDYMKKQAWVGYETEQAIIKELSGLIDAGRETDNKQIRASIYKDALDLVMELAVELPTYQRMDCVVYNKGVIDAASLNDKPTAYAGVIDKVWELDYN